jgi:hypothetical protein
MIQLHCGYYLHNNKIYTERAAMFDDMFINNDQTFKFCFNDEVFKALDWSLEPDISLPDLYKIRAQQLRESYDYLILSYSGGADSHEILCTFLENNIFIDEIQTVHYNEGIKNIDKNILLNDKVLSIYLEYEFAALPALRHVKKISPNTKITLIDASEFTVNDISTNKCSFMGMDKYTTNSVVVVQNTPFSKNFFMHHHNSKVMKNKLKTAFIRGAEKPSLKLNGRRLNFSFNDSTMNSVKMIQAGNIENSYTIENFFWTPDVPLIPIKQSHVIKKALEIDRQFLMDFIKSTNKKSRVDQHSDIYSFQRAFNRIIYTHWNDHIFTAPKSLDKSSDLMLVGMLTGDTQSPLAALTEQRNYWLKKFDRLNDKTLLNRKFNSDNYIIGDLNVVKN